MADQAPVEQVVKDILRATRRHLSVDDEIRMVLDGLCSEANIAELCRRGCIASSKYWSTELLEDGVADHDRQEVVASARQGCQQRPCRLRQPSTLPRQFPFNASQGLPGRFASQIV